jgi:hypothetical protein
MRDFISKLKISYVMSTDGSQARSDLLLHNHNLKGSTESDVITAFWRQSILGYLFRNFHRGSSPNSR